MHALVHTKSLLYRLTYALLLVGLLLAPVVVALDGRAPIPNPVAVEIVTDPLRPGGGGAHTNGFVWGG
jgi:hypothetical protein